MTSPTMLNLWLSLVLVDIKNHRDHDCIVFYVGSAEMWAGRGFVDHLLSYLRSIHLES
jgi:hypothetical protein